MPTIQDGRDAIEQGNLQQARLIFEAILQETPRSEDAWLGLAEVLTDTDDKRICYENVLKINKQNRAAREGLRNLEPQANPFIAQLQQAAGPADDELEEGDDVDETEDLDESTRATTRPTRASPPIPQPGDGPPTSALIAIGLLLSVVVFAIGGGTVFFVINSLR